MQYQTIQILNLLVNVLKIVGNVKPMVLIAYNVTNKSIMSIIKSTYKVRHACKLVLMDGSQTDFHVSNVVETVWSVRIPQLLARLVQIQLTCMNKTVYKLVRTLPILPHHQTKHLHVCLAHLLASLVLLHRLS